MKTRQLTIDAMLAAMCAVLGYLSLNFGNLKFTFESFPVHIGALLFGPADGMIIGGAGTLIYQLLQYGVTVTTPLWILPYVLCGLCTGWCAKKGGFSLGTRQTLLLVVLNELMITALNTVALYIDSKIFHYYTPSFITGVLGLRLVICVAKATTYGLALPNITRAIRQVICLHGAKDGKAL